MFPNRQLGTAASISPFVKGHLPRSLLHRVERSLSEDPWKLSALVSAILYLLFSILLFLSTVITGLTTQLVKFGQSRCPHTLENGGGIDHQRGEPSSNTHRQRRRRVASPVPKKELPARRKSAFPVEESLFQGAEKSSGEKPVLDSIRICGSRADSAHLRDVYIVCPDCYSKLGDSTCTKGKLIGDSSDRPSVSDPSRGKADQQISENPPLPKEDVDKLSRSFDLSGRAGNSEVSEQVLSKDSDDILSRSFELGGRMGDMEVSDKGLPKDARVVLSICELSGRAADMEVSEQELPKDARIMSGSSELSRRAEDTEVSVMGLLEEARVLSRSSEESRRMGDMEISEMGIPKDAGVVSRSPELSISAEDMEVSEQGLPEEARVVSIGSELSRRTGDIEVSEQGLLKDAGVVPSSCDLWEKAEDMEISEKGLPKDSGVVLRSCELIERGGDMEVSENGLLKEERVVSGSCEQNRRTGHLDVSSEAVSESQLLKNVCIASAELELKEAAGDSEVSEQLAYDSSINSGGFVPSEESEGSMPKILLIGTIEISLNASDLVWRSADAVDNSVRQDMSNCSIKVVAAVKGEVKAEKEEEVVSDVQFSGNLVKDNVADRDLGITAVLEREESGDEVFVDCLDFAVFKEKIGEVSEAATCREEEPIGDSLNLAETHVMDLLCTPSISASPDWSESKESFLENGLLLRSIEETETPLADSDPHTSADLCGLPTNLSENLSRNGSGSCIDDGGETRETFEGEGSLTEMSEGKGLDDWGEWQQACHSDKEHTVSHLGICSERELMSSAHVMEPSSTVEAEMNNALIMEKVEEGNQTQAYVGMTQGIEEEEHGKVLNCSDGIEALIGEDLIELDSSSEDELVMVTSRGILPDMIQFTGMKESNREVSNEEIITAIHSQTCFDEFTHVTRTDSEWPTLEEAQERSGEMNLDICSEREAMASTMVCEVLPDMIEFTDVKESEDEEANNEAGEELVKESCTQVYSDEFIQITKTDSDWVALQEAQEGRGEEMKLDSGHEREAITVCEALPDMIEFTDMKESEDGEANDEDGEEEAAKESRSQAGSDEFIQITMTDSDSLEEAQGRSEEMKLDIDSSERELMTSTTICEALPDMIEFTDMKESDDEQEANNGVGEETVMESRLQVCFDEFHLITTTDSERAALEEELDSGSEREVAISATICEVLPDMIEFGDMRESDEEEANDEVGEEIVKESSDEFIPITTTGSEWAPLAEVQGRSEEMEFGGGSEREVETLSTVCETLPDMIEFREIEEERENDLLGKSDEEALEGKIEEMVDRPLSYCEQDDALPGMDNESGGLLGVGEGYRESCLLPTQPLIDLDSSDEEAPLVPDGSETSFSMKERDRVLSEICSDEEVVKEEGGLEKSSVDFIDLERSDEAVRGSGSLGDFMPVVIDGTAVGQSQGRINDIAELSDDQPLIDFVTDGTTSRILAKEESDEVVEGSGSYGDFIPPLVIDGTSVGAYQGGINDRAELPDDQPLIELGEMSEEVRTGSVSESGGIILGDFSQSTAEEETKQGLSKRNSNDIDDLTTNEECQARTEDIAEPFDLPYKGSGSHGDFVPSVIDGTSVRPSQGEINDVAEPHDDDQPLIELDDMSEGLGTSLVGESGGIALGDFNQSTVMEEIKEGLSERNKDEIDDSATIEECQTRIGDMAEPFDPIVGRSNPFEWELQLESSGLQAPFMQVEGSKNGGVASLVGESGGIILSDFTQSTVMEETKQGLPERKADDLTATEEHQARIEEMAEPFDLPYKGSIDANINPFEWEVQPENLGLQAHPIMHEEGSNNGEGVASAVVDSGGILGDSSHSMVMEETKQGFPERDNDEIDDQARIEDMAEPFGLQYKGPIDGNSNPFEWELQPESSDLQQTHPIMHAEGGDDGEGVASIVVDSGISADASETNRELSKELFDVEVEVKTEDKFDASAHDLTAETFDSLLSNSRNEDFWWEIQPHVEVFPVGGSSKSHVESALENYNEKCIEEEIHVSSMGSMSSTEGGHTNISAMGNYNDGLTSIEDWENIVMGLKKDELFVALSKEELGTTENSQESNEHGEKAEAIISGEQTELSGAGIPCISLPEICSEQKEESKDQSSS